MPVRRIDVRRQMPVDFARMHDWGLRQRSAEPLGGRYHSQCTRNPRRSHQRHSQRLGSTYSPSQDPDGNRKRNSPIIITIPVTSGKSISQERQGYRLFQNENRVARSSAIGIYTSQRQTPGFTGSSQSGKDDSHTADEVVFRPNRASRSSSQGPSALVSSRIRRARRPERPALQSPTPHPPISNFCRRSSCRNTLGSTPKL